ncbi:hypothetical protein P3S68_019505 [Capsicum galapagoense]
MLNSNLCPNPSISKLRSLFCGVGTIITTNEEVAIKYIEISEQIDQDVKRTHLDLHFFSGDTPSSESNQDGWSIILIIFSKLNPDNTFYLFWNDPTRKMQ